MDPYCQIDQKAREIARIAHRGQVRQFGPVGAPNSSEEYWHHCKRVANTLDNHDMPNYVVAAGWLHDTIEDCEVRTWQIDLLLGVPTVSALVQEVTHVSKPTDGNRAARRALDRAHLEHASFFGAQIKCADIYDNEITSFPPDKAGFAVKYFEEKRLELVILEKILNRRGVAHRDNRIWELAMAANLKGPTIWKA